MGAGPCAASSGRISTVNVIVGALRMREQEGALTDFTPQGLMVKCQWPDGKAAAASLHLRHAKQNWATPLCGR